MFSLKDSTSKKSWLVYNPFSTAIHDPIKCEDDMFFSSQTADSSQSKAVHPLPFEGGVELADLKQLFYMHVISTFNCLINCS